MWIYGLWAIFILLGIGTPQICRAWTPPVTPYQTVGNNFWTFNPAAGLYGHDAYHLGDDIRASHNVHPVAIGDGVVAWVGYRPAKFDANGNYIRNYGGIVIIQYDGFYVLYGHLGNPANNKIFVHVGDHVVEGQELGIIGTRDENGGWSEHLHFQVMMGTYGDPNFTCESVNWAGTTQDNYDISAPCFCAAFNHWKDPGVFFGFKANPVSIRSSTVAPFQATADTSFTWDMTANGVDSIPMEATVQVTSAESDESITLEYMEGSVNPYHFTASTQMQASGLYASIFRLSTCDQVLAESRAISGPSVLPVVPPAPVCNPQPEICDNADNDCNGTKDNNIAPLNCINDCGHAGTKRCNAGVWGSCEVPEICDNVDNDCNGVVDSYTAACDPLWCNGAWQMANKTCNQGVWSGCPQACVCRPAAEICNNLDDNCNRLIDDGVTRPCTNECGNVGIETCVAGNFQACNAQPCCVPSNEVCDNADNNCDGNIDDFDEQCPSFVCDGIARIGVRRHCTAGVWNRGCAQGCPAPPPPPPPVSEPSEPPQEPICIPQPEICDGEDQDCDLIADNGASAPCSTACGTTGMRNCVSGVLQACDAPACPEVPPTPPPPPAESSVSPPPPPPPPPVVDRPPLVTPSDNQIREVIIGSDPRITLDWDPVANATSYEWEVLYAGAMSLVQRDTTNEIGQTSVVFDMDASKVGSQLVWHVRGRNSAGTSGPWSLSRTLTFSYHVGSYVRCQGADCPAQDAWYKVSSDTQSNIDGPTQFILDYVNAACSAGHFATGVSYNRIRGYARSNRFNGCPP